MLPLDVSPFKYQEGVVNLRWQKKIPCAAKSCCCRNPASINSVTEILMKIQGWGEAGEGF
jgi:hypothetical protein